MLYTIVEAFSPGDGESWSSYCDWRGIALERFDSIDRIMRPALFNGPATEEDWSHVVNADCMVHLMTDLEYAVGKQREIGSGDLVGVRLEDHDEKDERFAGYDLIDGSWAISLLTNWGNDNERISRSLSPCALISDYQTIGAIRDHLLATAGEDGHVCGCRIISIYRITG